MPTDRPYYIVESMHGYAFFDDLVAVAQVFSPGVVYGYNPPLPTLRTDAFVQRDPVFWDYPPEASILPVYSEPPRPEDVPAPVAVIIQVRPGDDLDFLR